MVKCVVGDVCKLSKPALCCGQITNQVLPKMALVTVSVQILQDIRAFFLLLPNVLCWICEQKLISAWCILPSEIRVKESQSKTCKCKLCVWSILKIFGRRFHGGLEEMPWKQFMHLLYHCFPEIGNFKSDSMNWTQLLLSTNCNYQVVFPVLTSF